jgi:hypothetical protein
VNHNIVVPGVRLLANMPKPVHMRRFRYQGQRVVEIYDQERVLKLEP